MKRVVGFRDSGRHFKFQGFPGIVSFTSSSHAEGRPCARTWYPLKEENINLFSSFLSLLTPN